ncbi:hypothetical protein ACJRO7_021304 [Eucalyptus globulus]|uniref:TIR domain-containing protein n=1 Tax=Eucalyptus globulus TaxID=34317 RepID=A0ABD3KJC2_EUCGL
MVCYQVFISFRGSDTRDNLVEYLYDQLKRLGVVAFLDSKEIDYGQEISTEIVAAIERSDICVPVFSQDFASSPACLMEVAQMVQSKKKILPIFFFVEPCDVRHQLGTYKKSFTNHESKKRYSKSTIEEWRKALTKIADNRGPEFKKASLEAPLKAAVEAALEAPLKAALEAALGEIDGIHGPESKKAALEAALKAALKAALEEIGVIKGPEIKNAAPGEIRGTMGRFYKDLFSGFQELEVFISELWKLLRRDEQDVTQNLVGIHRDLPEMMRKLGFDYEDGRVVKELEMTGRMVFVVFGLPGVGKTTLTNVVFHKISHLFDGCSFLENVRDEFERKRDVSLQNKLIRELKGGGACPEVKSSADGITMIRKIFRDNRVLIVLDNVDHFDQIKTFAEELTWFGPGSKIILTTRKKNVIEFYKNPDPEKNRGKVFREHEVSPMDKTDALKLFYKHAFPPDCCLEDNEVRSLEIISAVDRVPFAIETVGRYLYGKSEEDWTETSKHLKSRPEKQLEPILMEYFKVLCDNDARQIFLDIACFFTGVEKRIPYYMWDARGWNPHRSVGHLGNMSFIRIGEENEFVMYNQLRSLGREIVTKEDQDPRQRSRLWDYEDFQRTLCEKKVTSKVEALRVTPPFEKVDVEVFRDLSKLRFLELDEVDVEGNTVDLLPDLIWLDWRGCPKKSSGRPEKSKLFAFSMKRLVILNLCSSPDKLTVEEWEQLMERAQSLEVLKLKDCTYIKASLKFPASSLLKCLILEGSLYLKLDTSNSNFENLVSFSMKHCKWVNCLPQALYSMKVLKELVIDGTNIKKLQFESGCPPALKILSACDCKALHEVTGSIKLFKNLQKLILSGCHQLTKMPHVFGKLVQLQELDLSYTSIDELPPCIKECNKLEVLKMVRTSLKRFPKAIKNLRDLKELDFTLCGGLSGQCCDITGLFSLRILRLTGTQISGVLARDEGRFCLHVLELDPDVLWQTPASQKKSNVSKRKRKRQTPTNQKNSCVSKPKRKRDK